MKTIRKNWPIRKCAIFETCLSDFQVVLKRFRIVLNCFLMVFASFQPRRRHPRRCRRLLRRRPDVVFSVIVDRVSKNKFRKGFRKNLKKLILDLF